MSTEMIQTVPENLTREQLVADVEAFIEESGMSGTELSYRMTGSASFVSRLRKPGYMPRRKTIARFYDFRAAWRDKAAKEAKIEEVAQAKSAAAGMEVFE